MTDLLSPLLYVMEKEEDAYICFAAMFKRIHENFGEWCDGALNKLERLRHLCEVLDPELYRHLSDSSTGDDPFILFFGMLLIECRREFSFNETLHLLEVMWCAAFPRQKDTRVPQFEWAYFMTNVSVELVKEVFTSNSPYSAERLQSLSLTLPPVSRSYCHSTATTPSSEPVDIPHQKFSSIECHSNEEGEPMVRAALSLELSPGRDRASSLPDSKEYLVIDAKDVPPLQSTKSEGDIPTDEEEKNDIVNDLESGLARTVNKKLKGNNEMSDLSSVSSVNTASSNGVGRHTNNEGVFSSPSLTRSNGSALPQASSHGQGTGAEEDESTTLLAEGENVNERSLEIPKCVSDTALRDYESTQFDFATQANEDRSLTPPVKSKEDRAQKKYHTLPKEKQRFEESEISTYGLESNSLRASSPSHYLIHHLSSGMSSPYVSGINPRGLRRDRNRGEIFDSGVLPQNSSSGGESRRLFTIKRGEDSPYLPRSRSGSSAAPATPRSGIFEPERGGRASFGASLVAADEGGVLSQLVSIERARPVVDLKSSLKFKMSDSFSLFVCLSILLSHRRVLLSRPVDFVTLSLILSSDSVNSMFKPILQTSHQLHLCYRKYLEMSKYTQSSDSSDDKWLDDFGELLEEVTVSQDSPLRISPATSCSINNFES